MRLTRTRLVYQTQSEEPQNRAYCGLYSINNAMQEVNFISVKDMEKHLEWLKKTHPDEDNGHPVNGHYSGKALHKALQKKGYNLVYMNRMANWTKTSGKGRFKRLAYTQFRRVIIIGRTPAQKDRISHCIARVARTVETSTNKKVEKPVLICPDYGEIKECTPDTLKAFLPELEGAYAILSHAELKERREDG